MVQVNNMRHILEYLSGLVFIIALAIYIWFIIIDNIEHDTHSTEEIAWIYGFLVVLAIGFILTMYIISGKNKERIKT